MANKSIQFPYVLDGIFVRATRIGYGKTTKADLQITESRIFTPAASGSTGRIKVWGGAAWAAKPVKVWNGSTWAIKPLKRWNGSAWVVTNY